MARRSNSQTYLRPRSGNGRFRSALAEIQDQNACYQEQLIARERELLGRLAGLSPSRLAWYEDNDNVPAYGNTRQRVETLEQLVGEAEIENDLLAQLESGPCWLAPVAPAGTIAAARRLAGGGLITMEQGGRLALTPQGRASLASDVPPMGTSDVRTQEPV